MIPAQSLWRSCKPGTQAHPDVAALEDHGDGARLADGLIEAVDLRLHQVHEGRALAADAAAAGQDGQGTACKPLLSPSQTWHAQLAKSSTY